MWPTIKKGEIERKSCKQFLKKKKTEFQFVFTQVSTLYFDAETKKLIKNDQRYPRH